MNISRNFILVGGLFLLTGILVGIYMGASGNHNYTGLHAHLNLLGFTLMTIFGIVYRVFPSLAENTLARAHFWLHTIGSLLLFIMLALLFSETIAEASMFPVAPIAEVVILAGLLAFLWNVIKNLE